MMTLKAFFALCLLATCTISGILISVTTESAIAAAQPERLLSSKGQATRYSLDKGLSLYKAKKGLYQPQREAFASVRPVSRSLLSAPFVLKIEKIFKDQGSVVKKGETMASISSPALSKMINQWEHALDQVKLAQDTLELVSLKRNVNGHYF